MSYHVTNNHDAIRTWIEQHDGEPAVLRGTPDTLTSLSIVWRDRGSHRDRELEKISWDEFFDAFETGFLAFQYSDDRTNRARHSFNFLSREDVPALNDRDFILPEVNETAEENMFPSAPNTQLENQE